MTLKDYLMQTSEGEEITVWDDTYDMEVYFYNQTGDAWDDAMMDFASKLDIVDVKNSGVVVDMYGLIERNIDALEASDLFINPDVDSIMDDMENILSGYVSEDWLVKFVSCLNSDVSASTKTSVKKYIKSGKSSPELHKTFDGLDDRFDFDLDDEFDIYVRNNTITCYTIDSHVFGDGAGISYTIAIPVGEDDFWDIDRFIQRGLDEYLEGQLSGSDYTYGINEISKEPMFDVDTSDIPANVDTYNLYFADVEVVPYQNISGWGDYGIDFGTEEYTDHITKGTPWPPEYE